MSDQDATGNRNSLGVIIVLQSTHHGVCVVSALLCTKHGRQPHYGNDSHELSGNGLNQEWRHSPF
jgi:hypothetical protein